MPGGLITDLYELNMAASYLRRSMTAAATFSLFVRQLPASRGFLIAAGLEDCLAFLQDFSITDDELGWLGRSQGYDEQTLQSFRRIRFTGDVWAVPEGTPVFAGEPLLELTAPIAEAQLAETAMLNHITFQTSIASWLPGDSQCRPRRPARTAGAPAPANAHGMTDGCPAVSHDGVDRRSLKLTLLGVGAMNSPRYAPAGLLAVYNGMRVAIDGGPGAVPAGPPDAWLVSDERAELIAALRRLTSGYGLMPYAGDFARDGLQITVHPVIHTSHPTFGYLIQAAGRKVAWAPEFLEFPDWAAGADLMFADAAGWARPIRFAHGAGGHAAALAVAEQAAEQHVRRLVFAHIGRPTIAAIDAGKLPPFGEFGADGGIYLLSAAARGRRAQQP